MSSTLFCVFSFFNNNVIVYLPMAVICHIWIQRASRQEMVLRKQNLQKLRGQEFPKPSS